MNIDIYRLRVNIEIDEERYFIRFIISSDIDKSKLDLDYKPESQEEDEEDEGEDIDGSEE